MASLVALVCDIQSCGLGPWIHAYDWESSRLACEVYALQVGDGSFVTSCARLEWYRIVLVPGDCLWMQDAVLWVAYAVVMADLEMLSKFLQIVHQTADVRYLL